MFFFLHILLMATATSGIITGVSVAMFFRKKKNWLKIHRSVNSFCLGGIAAGIIMAFSSVYTTGGEHLDGMHQIIGLTAFISASAAFLAGFYQFKANNHGYGPQSKLWKQFRSKLRCIIPSAVRDCSTYKFQCTSFLKFESHNKSAFRTAHRWLGRFSLLMCLTAVTLGLLLINII